ARSPATPTSGITAETTKTAPNPDTATICPERNEPVITPKSVKAQNVAIAVPRSAGPARSIASAWSAGWAVAKPMPTATPARRNAAVQAEPCSHRCRALRTAVLAQAQRQDRGGDRRDSGDRVERAEAHAVDDDDADARAEALRETLEDAVVADGLRAPRDRHGVRD